MDDLFTYDVSAILRGLARAPSAVALLETELLRVSELQGTDDVVLVVDAPTVGRQIFRPSGTVLRSAWQHQRAASAPPGLYLDPAPPGWTPGSSPFVPAAELALQLDGYRQSATIDPLTGATNRRGLRRAFDRTNERLARQDSTMTVVVIDVDGMKEVNDRAGHAAGDTLLIALARALRRFTRATDVVTRLGGDEFALLLEDAAPGSEEFLLRRVERAVADATPVPVRLSWGSSRAPGESRDLGRLLALADERMYIHKGYRTRQAVAR